VEGADLGRHPPRRYDLHLGVPAFDPDTGEVALTSIERQTELALEQMKRCLENGRIFP
jgi:hypothetical protein